RPRLLDEYFEKARKREVGAREDRRGGYETCRAGRVLPGCRAHSAHSSLSTVRWAGFPFARSFVLHDVTEGRIMLRKLSTLMVAAACSSAVVASAAEVDVEKLRQQANALFKPIPTPEQVMAERNLTPE